MSSPRGGLQRALAHVPRGPGPPLYVPLDHSEVDELSRGRIELLPKKLRMLLKRHRAPVRSLFSTLDGNLDGAITRHELWTSLQAIGVPLCLEDADLLFRALLEFAIGKGEVSLSFRAVQKALLSPELGELVWEMDQDRRSVSKAQKALAITTKAEHQAAKALKEKADAVERLRVARSRMAALNAYVDFLEGGQTDLEVRMSELAHENVDMHMKVAEVRREHIHMTEGAWNSRSGSPRLRPSSASPRRSPWRGEIRRSDGPNSADEEGNWPNSADEEGNWADSPLGRWRAQQRGGRGGRGRAVGAGERSPWVGVDGSVSGSASTTPPYVDSPLGRWRAEQQQGSSKPSSGGASWRAEQQQGSSKPSSGGASWRAPSMEVSMGHPKGASSERSLTPYAYSSRPSVFEAAAIKALASAATVHATAAAAPTASTPTVPTGESAGEWLSPVTVPSSVPSSAPSFLLGPPPERPSWRAQMQSR